MRRNGVLRYMVLLGLFTARIFGGKAGCSSIAALESYPRLIQSEGLDSRHWQNVHRLLAYVRCCALEHSRYMLTDAQAS